MVGSTDGSIPPEGVDDKGERDDEAARRARLQAIADEHRARTSHAVETLRGMIRNRSGNGPTLQDIIEGWVDSAILRGLIKLDESGLALAEDPARAHVSDIPEDHPDRSEEYRKRLAFGSTFSWVDPDHLNESIGDTREVEALAFLLKLGSAQAYAQALLGAEMIEVPTVLSVAAYELAELVGPVANCTFRGASRKLFDNLRPQLEAFLHERTRVEPWKVALQIAMFTLPVSGKRGRAAVEYILDLMAAGCVPPGRFQMRLRQDMEEAVRVLRALETADGKSYRIVHRPKPGKNKVSVWGAARKFAAAFAFKIGKESAAKRDRTDERSRVKADKRRRHRKTSSRKMPPRETGNVDRGNHRSSRGRRDPR